MLKLIGGEELEPPDVPVVAVELPGEGAAAVANERDCKNGVKAIPVRSSGMKSGMKKSWLMKNPIVA